MAAYRLSDDERDEAVSALADAFVEGRLDDAEFDRRMGVATRATLATDLDPLFTDLPASGATRAPNLPTWPTDRRSCWATHSPNLVTRPADRDPRRIRQPNRPFPGLPVLAFLVLGLLVLSHGWLLIPLTFLLVRATGHRRSRGCR